METIKFKDFYKKILVEKSGERPHRKEKYFSKFEHKLEDDSTEEPDDSEREENLERESKRPVRDDSDDSLDEPVDDSPMKDSPMTDSESESPPNLNGEEEEDEYDPDDKEDVEKKDDDIGKRAVMNVAKSGDDDDTEMDDDIEREKEYLEKDFKRNQKLSLDAQRREVELQKNEKEELKKSKVNVIINPNI